MIRKTILALALALSPVQAASDNAESLCREMGELAEAIMSYRQSGLRNEPMQQLIDQLIIELPPRESVFVMAVYWTAQDVPIYSNSEREQEVAIEKFGNDVEIACLKEFQ